MANRSVDRLTRERPNRSRHRKQLAPTLGNFGIGVYRPLEAGAFDEPLRAFIQETTGVVKRVRGLGPDAAPATSIIEVQEVKRQGRLFREVLTQDAIDVVYHGLRELRKPQPKVQMGDVDLFGPKNAAFPTIGVRLGEKDAAVSQVERQLALHLLEDMSDNDLFGEGFEWNNVHYPHISLGRVPKAFVADPKRKMSLFAAVTEALPETINLGRAHLHNPASGSVVAAHPMQPRLISEL